MKKKIPWNDLCKAAFMLAQVLPHQFWRMTFLEYKTIFSNLSQPSLITREELAKMIKQFPDKGDNK